MRVQPIVQPLIQPIVPVLYPTAFDDPAWLFEPKYDGFRGVLYLNRRECVFRSKKQNIMRRFQELCYWVREQLSTRDVILDGEIVALDDAGRPDFRALMSGRGNLHYAAFDVLWIKGRDLRNCDLARRKRVLNGVIRHSSTAVSRVTCVRGRGRELLAAVQRLDLEGIVAKRLRDPYHPTTQWLKVRNGAYTQLAGRRELFHGPPGRA